MFRPYSSYGLHLARTTCNRPTTYTAAAYATAAAAIAGITRSIKLLTRGEYVFGILSIRSVCLANERDGVMEIKN